MSGSVPSVNRRHKTVTFLSCLSPLLHWSRLSEKNISHDGAILGSILSAGLRHVVVASSTVSTKPSLSGFTAQCAIGLSALARQITHAALGTVVTGVGAAGETPVDIGRWYPVLEGNNSVARRGKDHGAVRATP